MTTVDFNNDVFIGANLKLARVLSGLTMAELAQSIDVSRQYIHQIESSIRIPHKAQLSALAQTLKVEVGFFNIPPTGVLDEASVHFRSIRSAKQSSRAQAKASVALFIRLIDFLSDYVVFPELNLPELDIPQSSLDIELIAEHSRRHWDLGIGPLNNITRIVECAGVITTTFSGVSKDVDALSSVIKRPVIVRNDAKDSSGRLRFDIGHELGHLIMHQDVVTGCSKTEAEANRFASAFLLPRSSFAKEFKVGTRMDWRMLSALKERWGVSKAALLYRARQLDLLTESRYKSHIIMLKKYEAKKEKDDHLITYEKSELIADAIGNYLQGYDKHVGDLCEQLHVSPCLLSQVLGFDIESLSKNANDQDNIQDKASNVVAMAAYR